MDAPSAWNGPRLRTLAIAALLGLIGLGLAWELWLAPTGARTLALKVLPLLLPLPGLLRALIRLTRTLPERMKAGQRFVLELEIENSGDTLWLAGTETRLGTVMPATKLLSDTGNLVKEIHGEPPLPFAVITRAPALSRLLTYVCGQYLAGRGEFLKEYTVGTEALGRGPNFDPDHDSVVRVMATRLRKRLAAYYAEEGAGHNLRIQLPESGYSPKFVRNPAVAEGSATRGTW